MITIKNAKEIELMREAGKVVATLYDYIEEIIKPGMTTYEDQLAEAKMRELGATPAEKGYDIGVKGVPPYPASLCVSINDEVIHGVPSKHKIIKEGDIVSVDTVALKNGFNGDAARTFVVGKVSKEAQRLIDVQGHGIGRDMHEDPGIPNYGKAGRGARLEPGMTICVEPMVIQGKPDILELDDGWTIITEDGSLAAHYENTILITKDEPEILTMTKKDKQKYKVK